VAWFDLTFLELFATLLFPFYLVVRTATNKLFFLLKFHRTTAVNIRKQPLNTLPAVIIAVAKNDFCRGKELPPVACTVVQ